MTGLSAKNIFYLASFLVFSGCASYKKSLFLKVPPDTPRRSPTTDLLAPKNQKIAPLDQLALRVFTSNGEALIDPNRISEKNSGTGENPVTYLVDQDGRVRLPLIGMQTVKGMTLEEAEVLLASRYNEFYANCFVVLKITNNRVTVIANGGTVIPLPNQGTSVLEVIAMAGDIAREANTDNIRLLRDGEIFLINLSQLADYPSNNMIVRSGDIIYLEPVRRPLVEGLRDASPFVSITISLLTIILLFRSTN